MGERLESRQAFVTGAAQGIGRAIVEAFAGEGAHVVAADLHPDVLSDIAGSTITAVMLDATSAADVMASAADWPETTILVNCVGFVANGTILDSPSELLQRSFDINVGTAHNTIRAFLPAMLAQGAGTIINIASVVSATKAVPDRYAYATTKAALIGLTKSVARDFIDRGIRCNSISPGTVQSPSFDARMVAHDDPDAALRAFVARQPIGRIGRPQEVAAIATMLALDEAAFLTGADIIIDGGMSL